MDDMFISFLGEGMWAVVKAALILILAFAVAAIVKSLVVKLLAKTRISSLLGKTDASPDGGKRMLEHIGRLIHLLVFLLFVPGIFESLGMHEISLPILNLLDTMWGYLPNILAAVLILPGCFVCNTMVQKALQKKSRRSAALFCKCGIYAVGGIMILNELGIAAEIVNMVFIILITAFALAFAIAFGIGGRESAGRFLRKLEEKKED